MSGLDFTDRFSPATIASGNGIFSNQNSANLVSNPNDAFSIGKLPSLKGVTADLFTGNGNPKLAGATIPGTDTGAGNAAPTGGAGASASGVGAFIGSYFMRGVVIILGFVFVAVGLTMFKGNVVQVLK